jgi:7-cyano-7-deazaguanine synthase in queuosine biosynthesis
MDKILVICNQSNGKALPGKASYDETIAINPNPPRQNLKLHIESITHRILTELNPMAHDLLEIAAYVYYADCSISRGRETDVYAEKWQRKFDLVIPVSDPSRWNEPEVRDLLKETLDFLTGDDFSFTFTPPRPTPRQLYLNFAGTLPPFPSADSVCLFSGGIDSLIGSLFILKERNERPLLVSHRSVPLMDSRQKRLVKELQQRNTAWEFPHLSVWVNRMGNRAAEMTQRSRSFLYLSIATSVASQLKMKKIYLCENGIVSLNIPISPQTVGTLLTRTTHPKFLSLFNRLIQKLFGDEFSVENPFVFYTKTQLLEMLKGWNLSELLQATISCSYAQGKTKLQPQCGTCFQCVGRRFSVIAAGLEEHDPPEYYEKDLFLEALEEGKETASAEGYVRTAFEIDEMDDVRFFSAYPELEEAVNFFDIAPDECAQKLYGLFRCHASEVINTATAKCNEYQKDLLAGKLPDTCLLSMLAHRRHLSDPMSLYAENIGKTLARALRIDFQTEKPRKEKRLQESAQAALAAADERLRRESPMLSYTVVLTKPDFSAIRDFNRILFLELKLLNSRSKLNKIVTEITSRITIYRDQGAYVLFVVYDTNDFIVNDEEFVADLEKHDRIRAIVVR